MPERNEICQQLRIGLTQINSTHELNCTRKVDQTVEEVETLLLKKKAKKIIVTKSKIIARHQLFFFCDSETVKTFT